MALVSKKEFNPILIHIRAKLFFHIFNRDVFCNIERTIACFLGFCTFFYLNLKMTPLTTTPALLQFAVISKQTVHLKLHRTSVKLLKNTTVGMARLVNDFVFELLD